MLETLLLEMIRPKYILTHVNIIILYKIPLSYGLCLILNEMLIIS